VPVLLQLLLLITVGVALVKASSCTIRRLLILQAVATRFTGEPVAVRR